MTTTKTNRSCDICGEAGASASKADGGLLMCKKCRKDFGSPVKNSRPGAVRR